MEASEVSEFSKEMKEAGEGSMTHVALIISVVAVLVALVTVLGHREHTEAVLQQARASDAWNEYQAHKIRLQLEAGNSVLLTLQPSSNSAAVQTQLSAYKTEMAHLNGDLEEDKAHAREFQAEVDKSERKAARFDLGEALLEIAVVLASITLITRQWRYVIAALALGAAGLVTAALAFTIR